MTKKIGQFASSAVFVTCDKVIITILIGGQNLSKTLQTVVQSKLWLALISLFL